MYRLSFWILLGSITCMALIPSYETLPNIISYSDTLNHFGAFFTLTIVYRLAYPAHPFKKQFLAIVFFGLMIEFVQYFLPTRSASLKDIAVDSVAILSAMLSQLSYLRFQQIRLNRI